MRDIYKQQIRLKLLQAFNFSTRAHIELMKEEPRLDVAIGDLAIASSYFNAAHTMYIHVYKQLGHELLNKLFMQFSEFIEETMENIRTDHGHQWSDIQFNELKELYNNVASQIGIPQ